MHLGFECDKIPECELIQGVPVTCTLQTTSHIRMRHTSQSLRLFGRLLNLASTSPNTPPLVSISIPTLAHHSAYVVIILACLSITETQTTIHSQQANMQLRHFESVGAVSTLAQLSVHATIVSPSPLSLPPFPSISMATHIPYMTAQLATKLSTDEKGHVGRRNSLQPVGSDSVPKRFAKTDVR